MLTKILIALIRVYQLTLSRLILAVFGPVCRFEPSCSRYAVACLEGHGAVRGTLLSVRRLCKCHPFHPGGYDPPPPPREARQGRALHRNGDVPQPRDGTGGARGEVASNQASLAEPAAPPQSAGLPSATQS